MRASRWWGDSMFNQYLEITLENADIAIANAVIENLKFIVISLDLIFRGTAGEAFYYEDYTFYFYHLQNALTSCGNITNVFSDNLQRNERHNVRAKHLQEVFGIDMKKYKCLFDKKFRNANEHFDEQYDAFYMLVGDYNVVDKNTPPETRDEILRTPHIRTLDIQNWVYTTFDKRGKRIRLDLQRLRDEAYLLLYKISTHPRMKHARLTHIPTKEIING